MNVTVTGSNGFIGKNLVSYLKTISDISVFCVTKNTTNEELKDILFSTNFIYHLAGTTRSNSVEDFMINNVEFTKKLIKILKINDLKVPILFSSSIHAETNSEYGRTKLESEKLIVDYGKQSNVKVFLYRLSNVFGKWARPDTYGVVATFCRNVSRDISINVHDDSKILHLHYIDDVVESFYQCLNNEMNSIRIFDISLGDLAKKIRSYSNFSSTSELPKFENKIDKFLFSTYISYMPLDRIVSPLNSFKTNNSEFSELIKLNEYGQISLNIVNSKSIRGNHWHQTKHEKFLVIQGCGIIRQRDYYSREINEWHLNGKNLEWVDILPGFVHSIENTGEEPLITIMWASEVYDASNPDTFSENV